MEFIVFGTWQQLAKISCIEVKIRDDIVALVPFVRNLGYFMDELLKGNHHVNKITSQLFTCLRDIRSIRHHINQETAKITIQVLILCRLDYCNSLLAGAAQFQLDKLQRIQNMACRIIFNSKKYDHMTSNMMCLHWLCISVRITYKIATIMYSINASIAPKYLQDLVPKQTHDRRLRSSVSDSFPPPRCETSATQTCFICSVGPKSVEQSTKRCGKIW